MLMANYSWNNIPGEVSVSRQACVMVMIIRSVIE